ncbi:hypothetical protein [Mycobacterium parmense]|uniref:hypothetical protein n=1 Tax=Mycobacterium parmense TaxID=185642 RepID=UPI00111C02BB|nr:hypothetical protein [Mycobacterium parmense]MCV7353429.1 hypothetical protein [Mycobacterium parmense]
MKTSAKVARVTAGAVTALVLSAGFSGVGAGQVGGGSAVTPPPSSSAAHAPSAPQHATLTTCVSGLDPC